MGDQARLRKRNSKIKWATQSVLKVKGLSQTLQRVSSGNTVEKSLIKGKRNTLHDRGCADHAERINALQPNDLQRSDNKVFRPTKTLILLSVTCPVLEMFRRSQRIRRAFQLVDPECGA